MKGRRLTFQTTRHPESFQEVSCLMSPEEGETLIHQIRRTIRKS